MKLAVTILAVLTCAVCFGQTSPSVTTACMMKPGKDTIQTKIQIGFNKATSSDTTKLRFTCRATIQKSEHPLLIVDGNVVPFDQMEMINPSDIQSVTIFKGATALALYGTSAAKGVIVVSLRCEGKEIPVL